MQDETVLDDSSFTANHLSPAVPTDRERIHNFIRKKQGTTNLQSFSDYKLLLREAESLNATVSFYSLDKLSIEIAVQAPKGSLWANTNTDTITSSFQKSTPEQHKLKVRDAVQDLIEAMSLGFSKSTTNPHEDTCECDICEQSEEDLEDLDF